MFGLAHASFEWIFAGGIVFLGIIVVVIRAALGHIPHVASSAVVWIIVYSLHGGKANVGIMTATFAALLWDLFGLPIVKTILWLKRP